MEFGWNGAVEAFVDGSFVGNLATQSYVSGGYMPLGGGLVTGDLAVSGNLSVEIRVITHDLMNNTGVFYVAGSAADYFARNTSDGAWRWSREQRGFPDLGRRWQPDRKRHSPRD